MFSGIIDNFVINVTMLDAKLKIQITFFNVLGV